MDDGVVLSKDSFLTTLGIPEHEGRLNGVLERDVLFELVAELLASKGLLAAEHGESFSAHHPGELHLRIRGTKFFVRLSGLDRDEINSYVTAALLVIGVGNIDPKTLTVASILALKDRVQRLRAEYGELSIVNTLPSTERATVREITLALRGKPCLYPSAGCRYLHSNGKDCAIEPSHVEAIVQRLEERKVLRKKNAHEPFEYGIVL